MRDLFAYRVPVSKEMYGRSFLKELDVSVVEWHELLKLARELKLGRRAGQEIQRLVGRQIVLVFEKASTRTRCAFEVAAHEQGAQLTYLDPTGSHLGHKESISDTARVLGRMYDGIEYRGSDQSVVEELAAASGIPVWNGLTDQWHPTQSLCDMLTMTEHCGRPRHEISFAYLGDARNNVANSLAVAGAMMGMDVRMVSPESLRTDPGVIQAATRIAAGTGATIRQTADVEKGVDGVDFLYTDVWLSMGESPQLWPDRIDLLADYAVSMNVVTATGNPDVKFMHCLPAFHNRQTAVGQQIYELTGRSSLEVDDDVFESAHSVVFDQAENRLHTIKAVMVATLGLQTCE